MEKRHTPKEILAKLQHAERLERQGKPQREIADVLGVTPMTFHRWKKKYSSRPKERYVGTLNESGSSVERASTLQAENATLRQLVVELLLEKEKLTKLLKSEKIVRGRK